MQSDFLSLQKFLLKLIGATFDEGKSFFQNPLLFLFGFISTALLDIAMIFYVFANFDDLDKATDCLNVAFQGASCSLKTICFIWQREGFRAMYHTLDSTNKKLSDEYKSSFENLKKYNDKAVKISTAYVWACYSAGAIGQVLPFLNSCFMYFFKGNDFDKEVPYLA